MLGDPPGGGLSGVKGSGVGFRARVEQWALEGI